MLSPEGNVRHVRSKGVERLKTQHVLVQVEAKDSGVTVYKYTSISGFYWSPDEQCSGVWEKKDLTDFEPITYFVCNNKGKSPANSLDQNRNIFLYGQINRF